MKTTLLSTLLILITVTIFAQNIGINITNPKNPLHIKGRTQIDGRLFLNTQKGMPDTPNSNLLFGQITAISESQDSSDIDLVLYENSNYYNKLRRSIRKHSAI